MTTQSNQPVEKTEVEKQQTPEQIQSKATDRTLAQAVVEARDTSRPLPASIQQRDSSSVATAARPTYAAMAENALDVHLNGTDILRPTSHIAEENFARTNIGSSSFEARQYVVQANMADSRPAVETVKLNAGGQEYQGFRYMNPESGKEYFYANDSQHAGQRFELTKSDTGYTGLKQLGTDGENKTIPITREPAPATAFRGDGELGGNRPPDSAVQFRPQPMSAPQGERTQPAAPPERTQTAPAAPDKPVSINPQLLSQIKTQLEANPKMVDELQRQADKDWRAAAILKELGYQRPDSTANGGAPRQEQQPPAKIEQQQQQPKAEQQQQQLKAEQQQQQSKAEQQQQQPTPVDQAGRQPQIKPVDTVLQGKAQVDAVRPPTPNDAAQTASNKPPQSLETLVASRLGDPQSRQAAVDALQLAQKGKVPVEGDAQQTMRLQQLVQNIGPAAFGRLQAMIQDQTNANMPLRLDGKFDPVTAARLRDFLDLTLSGTARSLAGDRTSINVSTNAANAAALIGRNLGEQQSGSTVAKDFLAIGGAAAGAAMLGDMLNRAGRPQTPADPLAAQRPDALRPDPRLQPEGVRQDGQRADASRPELRPEIKLDPARNEAADRQEKVDSHADQIGHTNEIAAAAEHAVTSQTQSELDAKGQMRPTKEQDEKLKEEEARHEKEEEAARLRKAEDEARKQREQSESAAIMAMLSGKKGPKDAQEKEEETAAEKAKRDDEKRVKYIVKQGDTLESIAAKMLRDKSLAGLIYDINKTIIPSKLEAGRNVPDLKVGLAIWLPTTHDIRDYRVKLMTGGLQGGPATSGTAQGGTKFADADEELAARFGSSWSGNTAGAVDAPTHAPTVPVSRSPIPPAPLPGMVPGTAPSVESDAIAAGLDDAARQAYATRRQNVENMLGPLTKKPPEELKPRYVVRLGDTLKSVAMKHPALNDVKLWRLLAEVNGLSTGVDDKGNPLVSLKRGQVLSLPMQEEVDAFLGTSPAPKQEPPNSVPDLDVSYAGIKAVGSTSDAAKVRKQRVSSAKLKAVDPCEPGYKILNQRSASSRVLQAGDPKDLTGGFKLRLESKQGDTWVPVVSYEIYEDVSLRHEYQLSGDRRTIRIDLPAAAAVELAQNDITSNWTNYCLKFNKK